MNSAANTSKNVKLFNSLVAPLGMMNKNVSGDLPTPMAAAANAGNSAAKSWMPEMPSMPESMPDITGIVIFVVLVAAFITLLVVFKDQLQTIWSQTTEVVKGYFATPPAPGSPAPAPGMPKESKGQGPNSDSPPESASQESSDILEKVLPGGKNVFNVSSNRYTYYDAEPLCKALGAELATYDQVKEAWSQGADWCNYGWVKGQMAVFPTSDETYAKAQSGPEDQRMSCGVAGVNGGYFDNPEMRFGVNCYGSKPPQSKHDQTVLAKGAPLSPGALEFDKKVNRFKSESDHIGILPFNINKWA
jgi:hypothetical protein